MVSVYLTVQVLFLNLHYFEPIFVFVFERIPHMKILFAIKNFLHLTCLIKYGCLNELLWVSGILYAFYELLLSKIQKQAHIKDKAKRNKHQNP